MECHNKHCIGRPGPEGGIEKTKDFYGPRITLIDANERMTESAFPKTLPNLGGCETPNAFASSAAAPCALVFAFICVIRGLNFGCGGAAQSADWKPRRIPESSNPEYDSLRFIID
jgi:hypothetical protein